MAKVLLINPPFEQEEESVGKTESIKKVLNIVPPLGIAYIASVLEKMKIEIKIIDCAIGISYDNLFRMILTESPDVVGLTSTTPSFVKTQKVAKFIRENFPETKILIGGAHVTALPEETIKTGLFDIGVICEGEKTIQELFKSYQNERFENLDKIKGIIYKDGEVIHQNKDQSFIQDLDSIPLPARHLLPHPKFYRPTPASCRRAPYAVIMTSRGCPSVCTFCDRKVFGERCRMRSVANIFEEIESLISKYGVREIRFFDDTFTSNKKRVYEICDEFEKRKLRLSWTCLTKAACVDGPLLKRMKKTGCWQVLYGFESGDDRMLKLFKKGNTVEINKRAIKLTKEAGLEVRGDFIVGTPGETWESLERTVRFTIDMKLDYAHFNKFIPFPGTELYKKLTKEGHVFDFSKSTVLDHKEIYYINPGMDKDEFSRFLDRANKRFYLRPGYILKRLLSIRTLHQLKGQIDGFFAIFDL
ncbi:B12-binding domain-containing radical SAM protein [Candidatus Omnitrophota bacterium]